MVNFGSISVTSSIRKRRNKFALRSVVATSLMRSMLHIRSTAQLSSRPGSDTTPAITKARTRQCQSHLSHVHTCTPDAEPTCLDRDRVAAAWIRLEIAWSGNRRKSRPILLNRSAQCQRLRCAAYMHCTLVPKVVLTLAGSRILARLISSLAVLEPRSIPYDVVLVLPVPNALAAD
jgi:hypothetical protein